MKQTTVVAAILLSTIASTALAADHSLVPRFAGSAILKSESRYAEYTLVVKPIEQADPGKRVLGRTTRFAYEAPKGTPMSEVFQHYQSSVRTAGFDVLYNCAGQSCAPATGGKKFSDVVAAQDLRPMQGRPDGQRYFSAQLRRSEGDAYVALYCVRDEAQYKAPSVACSATSRSSKPPRRIATDPKRP